MVASAVLSSIQPPNHLAVTMTACAQKVEDLKERLNSAVDNDEENECSNLLDQLREAVLNRELLEVTRVGFHVNNVRKLHLKKWPQISKKSRDLIKYWQEMTEEKGRTHSGASSLSSTPSMLSPSMAKLARRGVTPNTPLNRRVTSTGIQNGRLSALVSPANGSYAPRNQISPTGTTTTNGIPKSQSVGVDLLKHNNKPMTPKEDGRNGKRKAVDELANTANSIKRTKTATGSLVSPSAQSVMVARKAVTSTSELVAQLSQSLPQHMSIDTSIREHEQRIKREHKEEEIDQSSQTAMNAVVERKKRKYERKQKPVVSPPKPEPPKPATPVPEERRSALIVRFNRNGSSLVPSTSSPSVVKEEPAPKTFEKVRSIPKATTPPPAVVKEEVDSVDSGYVPPPKIKSSTRKDWSSLIPSMAELRIRAEKNKIETEALVKQITEATKADPTKVQRIKNFRRPILMLPYLDNPIGPDFLIHKYRNASQYYADDNFLYSDDVRPTD